MGTLGTCSDNFFSDDEEHYLDNMVLLLIAVALRSVRMSGSSQPCRLQCLLGRQHGDNREGALRMISRVI